MMIVGHTGFCSVLVGNQSFSRVIYTFYQPKENETAKEAKLTAVARECWATARGEMLRFLSSVRGGLLYWQGHGDAKDYTIDPLINDVLRQLPRNELRLAAREMLAEDREGEFACRVLGDFETAEDLPFLHTKLQNTHLHTAVRKAMEGIQ